MKAVRVSSLVIVFCLSGYSNSVFADSGKSAYRVIAGKREFVVEIADTKKLHRKG